MSAYAMCPCCGRSILVDEKVRGKQRALWDERLTENASERGGEVWVSRTLGREPGSKKPVFERGNAPAALVARVLSELVRRCRAFLKAHEED